MTRLVLRIVLAAVLLAAYSAYRFSIESEVDGLGGQAAQVYDVVLIAAGALLAISITRAAVGLVSASRELGRASQPYRAARAAELVRHRQAQADWQETARDHQARAAALTAPRAARAGDALWFPVAPRTPPVRVDVVGGDPLRHGWASLLVTLGASLVSEGRRVTVLDLSGQDVGGGLAAVAASAGRQVHRLDLGEGTPVDLIGSVPRDDLGRSLAEALAGRGGTPEGWEERALAADLLRHLDQALDHDLTFARLAAGARVLRQGVGSDVLAAHEVERLIEVHIGDLDRHEWTSKQLRALGTQLEMLRDDVPDGPTPLWRGTPMSVVTTGTGTDRDDLLARVLVHLAAAAIRAGTLTGAFVLAGADRLGAATLDALADRSRRAGVQLLVMMAQPTEELERTVGTGGAVCLMKTLNHRDAAIAAEFVGRGHKFVVSQVSRTVGTTFTDGGGDSLGSSMGESDSFKLRSSGRPSRKANQHSTNRGRTWTDTRSWSSADNSSLSSTTSRVYEFDVEPTQMMALPETAFILVDATGDGRRVVLADANPVIALLDRVSRTPLLEAAR
ncbi:conserved hypothetical protein [Beutenbergia cavernae DSM 12333]|uniref:TraD/TraG TraM recognition site domain-containing protein n=1 Tax=Beutenbergia cavernae (strain ATCC BAA-8 / DSM 12333 / CCUG 43141 / JCM 11478 / NBRC 16432 / NCIMB 13614 / HKI 0122) TaxID=471853 RepID=C5C1P3_BEUC1|nr:hypothetical protein [Beutenbergia cavernae]ACQ79511.1 conserved hypothetical protein [Beutenbergia cavernae DSM 12333]